MGKPSRYYRLIGGEPHAAVRPFSCPTLHLRASWSPSSETGRVFTARRTQIRSLDRFLIGAFARREKTTVRRTVTISSTPERERERCRMRNLHRYARVSTYNSHDVDKSHLLNMQIGQLMFREQASAPNQTREQSALIALMQLTSICYIAIFSVLSNRS